jgi:hypothetical protein
MIQTAATGSGRDDYPVPAIDEGPAILDDAMGGLHLGRLVVVQSLTSGGLAMQGTYKRKLQFS